jgi:signal transduction histidine kinase
VKRSWPLALVVLVALAAVAGGGARLHATFAEERDAALDAVRERRDALTALAGERLARTLDRRLEESRQRIYAAAADAASPPGPGLLVRDGALVLPRLREALPGDATPALDHLRALRDGNAHPEAGPVGERRAIARRALESTRAELVEATLRELVQHRALHALPVEEDLPTALAALGTSDHALDPRFVRSLVYLDIETDTGSRAPPLLRALIEGRGRLTRADFDALATELRRLAQRHGVSTRQLDEVVDNLRDEQIVPPAQASGGYLEHQGDELSYWRQSAHELVGLRLGTAPLLADVTAALRAASPLTVDVRAGASGSAAARWLVIDAPDLDAQLLRASALYQLKAGLLAFSGLLALLSLSLGGLLVVRERRFVALRERFLGSVSHELRTPLASVRLLAETLERRLEGNGDARDYPARIVRDIDGLGFLVENLLSFQRLTKGGLLARPQRVRLQDALADLEEEVAQVARGGFELKLESGDDDEVFADPELLRLVLLNLGRNACLYNERDPAVVRVRVRDERGARVVEVEDNGVGVAAEERARVFEDFYRGKDAAGRTRGSGLGLPLCRQVMRAHGGAIEIADSGENGTTFALRFPEGAKT